ncbi:uncharacterized protein SOCEGT47_023460 [Sorangium cellulosum]|uniref:DUF2169 domain-containing protein n=1 Tax=Sorangium cellulosum TaxID=56 RepID=A0A4P2PYS8_SORCE|nr:DUF2169 domain-containing protein [Sorangium cellulosum]AUX21851.1 uncharacterized protein SOCEGT47_023460 [Sorangium cellulosum]
MHILSLRPLAASTILWRTPAGLSLSIPLKATFQLAPEAVASLTSPLPLFHDVFFEQNAGRSLYVASDAAPHKPRADVLLTGSAYAPPGQRVPHRWVRLAIFGGAPAQAPAIDKRIQVVGERRRDPATGQPSAAAPFARLPIRYELAHGGATFPENPVGMGADPADLRLPSLLDPSNRPAPVGFGPIPGTWPQRRRALAGWDPALLSKPVPELPTAMDWGYFNAAPRDQQIPYLQGDEWILFEGLHPTAAQVRSRLPGLEARVLVRAPPLTDPAGVELRARCDTLWIDADALRCTLTWRASLAVAEHALEALDRGSLVATLALPGERVAWPSPAAAGPSPAGPSPAGPSPAGPSPAGRSPAAPPVLPVGATTAPLPEGVRPPALPFGGPGASAGQASGPPAVLAGTREFNLQDVMRGLRQEDAPFPLAPARPPESAETEAARQPAEIPWESLKQAFPAMAAHIEALGGAPLPTATLPLPEPEPSRPTSEDLAASPDMPPPARTTENVPVLNLAPFPAFTLPWQVRPPRDSLTIVVKGTFTLVPGAPAAIAPDQELPAGDTPAGDAPAGDTAAEGGPAQGLRYPSDFAIFKPKADVLLVGHAHRPRGAEAAALVRLRLGDALDRAVVAVGPRRWDALGVPTAPEAWSRIPLRFEHAFGGPGFDANPAGTGYGARAGDALPSLELPELLIRAAGDTPPPACFAPVPAAWRERLQKIGTYGDRWRKTRWPFFPDDLDWTYFNAAPAPQQIPYPRGDEAFELWSVRPDGEVVRGQLPGVRVRVFAQATEQGGGGFSEVPMRLDTVWFDADALRLVLVWRGLLDVADEDASEIASLFVVSEPMGKGEPMTKSEARARFFAELAAREAAEQPPASNAESANDNAGEGAETALDAQIAERLATARARRRVAGGAAAAGAVAEAVAAADVDGEDLSGGAAASADAPPGAPAAAREGILELLRLGEPLAGLDLTGIDLSGASLEGRDLGGALLQRANLRGARLDGARLVEAVLAGADCEGASFEGADLTQADLTGANVQGARFSGAILALAAAADARCEGAVFEGARAPGASFAGAALRRARFDRADLSGAEMMGSALDEASFRDATLDDVKLYGASGSRVILDGASLADLRADDVALRGSSFRRVKGPGSVWEGADLTEGVFEGAALREASFTRATLDRAVLDAADLRDGRFRKARLRGARLVEANLMRAAFDSADLERADLRGANLYQAETWKARTTEIDLTGAFVAGTKLA